MESHRLMLWTVYGLEQEIERLKPLVPKPVAAIIPPKVEEEEKPKPVTISPILPKL